VWYLSYSDSPKKEGLIFPNELLKNTYSPGIWAIDLDRYQRYIREDIYSFDAVDKEEIVNTKLIKINPHVFQVDSRHGKFFFRIIQLHYRYNKYIGNSNLINKENVLYQVVSMDIPKLNKLCLEEKFFFVGRIDSNLERNIENIE
jgi:hypothetical protein